MEQGKVKAPLGNTATAATGGEDMKMKMKMKKMPAPEELISHYVLKGMDSQEASVKVIEDLQRVLIRVIASNRTKPDRVMSRKLDTINTRLAVLEMKLDSKPGYPQAFAVGLASGAALNAITSFMPHLFTALSNIWNSVSSSSSSS